MPFEMPSIRLSSLLTMLGGLSSSSMFTAGIIGFLGPGTEHINGFGVFEFLLLFVKSIFYRIKPNTSIRKIKDNF